MIIRDVLFKSKNTSIQKSLTQSIYFHLSILSLILSACFQKVEIQFIVFSIICGARWIASGKYNRTNIFIEKTR